MANTSPPSRAILTLAIIFVLLGIVSTFCGSCLSILPTEAGARVITGAWAFVGMVTVVLGSLVILGYLFVFKVKPGYALISKDEVIKEERWSFGRPKQEDVIAIRRTTLSFKAFQLRTPDEGALELEISVTYCPDDSSGLSLSIFRQVDSIRQQIEDRIKVASNDWIRQKPFPGTVRRALSMQREMQRFLFANLTEVSPNQALLVRESPEIHRQFGLPIDDLGVRLLDISVVEMRPVQYGTDKPDWGDLDVSAYNAQAVFEQLYAHAQNLSNLRALHDVLKKQFPEEQQDIEDIYDSIRISMKENRDR